MRRWYQGFRNSYEAESTKRHPMRLQRGSAATHRMLCFTFFAVEFRLPPALTLTPGSRS